MFLSDPDPPCSAALLAVADEAIRSGCRRVLESMKLPVREADGAEALAHLAGDLRPAVFITDRAGPDPVGGCALAALRARPEGEDVPVLVLCEREQVPGLIPRLAEGHGDYLTRPFTEGEFAFRVRSLMQRGLFGAHHDAAVEMFGENTRILSLLLDFSAVLAQAHDLDALIAETLQAAAAVSGCRRMAVLLPSPTAPVLVMHGSMGFDDADPSRLQVPIGEGVAGRVYLSGGRFVAPCQPGDLDTQADEDVHDFALYRSPPAVALALRSTERTVGVLYASDRVSGNPFAEYELVYLGLVGNCAGAGIQSINERQEREAAYEAITVSLASLAEHRHDETGRHLDRMTGYCLIIARRLQADSPYASLVDDCFLENLRRAAPLHDIGKVAVPDRILLKNGPLTPDEWKIMKTHARIGAEAIRAARTRSFRVPFLNMAEEIAAAHHEWVDGTGYPNGLAGTDIPLSARIAAVADVYDALSSQRNYKDAYSHEKARAIILDLAGRQFDRVVVDAFMASQSEIRALAESMDDGGGADRAAHLSATFDSMAAEEAAVRSPLR